MIPTVSGANRVIITATKTAFERNESHFGRYFVDAFAKDGADADKDGRVSLLEAFRYAALETKRFYDKREPPADRARPARRRRRAGRERRADRTLRRRRARAALLPRRRQGGHGRRRQRPATRGAVRRGVRAAGAGRPARGEEGRDGRRRVRRGARAAAHRARAKGAGDPRDGRARVRPRLLAAACAALACASAGARPERPRRVAGRPRQDRRRGERVRSRRRDARAGQPHGGREPRASPLQSRRARPRDEGVRPLHRRLQPARRLAHEQGDDRRRHRVPIPRPRRTRPVQGRAQVVRPRDHARQVEHRRQDRGGRAVPREVQQRRRAGGVRGGARHQPVGAAGAARRGQAALLRFAAGRGLADRPGARDRSELRRGAHAAGATAARDRGVRARAEGSRTRALGESGVVGSARRAGRGEVRDGRHEGLRGDPPARARAEPGERRVLRDDVVGGEPHQAVRGGGGVREAGNRRGSEELGSARACSG